MLGLHEIIQPLLDSVKVCISYIHIAEALTIRESDGGPFGHLTICVMC